MNEIKDESKLIKLNLGCGILFKAGWINVDKYIDPEAMKKGIAEKDPFWKNALWEEGAEYIQADILKLPFPDEYADYVLLDNVIEHFNIRDVIPAMKEIYRVMKNNAKIKIVTNNFDGLARDWIEFAMSSSSTFSNFNYDEFMNIAEVLYGNQVTEGELHRCPFNPAFMNFVLVAAGFRQGTMAVIKKHVKYPTELAGSVTAISPEALTRNEVLIVDALK